MTRDKTETRIDSNYEIALPYCALSCYFRDTKIWLQDGTPEQLATTWRTSLKHTSEHIVFSDVLLFLKISETS